MSEQPASRWPRPLRPFAARPRLLLGVAVGVAAYFLGMFAGWRDVTRVLIAWDCGVLAFGILILASMAGADHARIKEHAQTHDEGKHFILFLTIIAALASVAAIAAELGTARGTALSQQLLRLGLAAGTIVLSWAFVQLVFTLHYAHVYYDLEDDGSGEHKEGLEFPGGEAPDYWDFLHFAVIIGATAQTADITIVSKELRRISTVHSLIAFSFNTAILALMINLAAGLF